MELRLLHLSFGVDDMEGCYGPSWSTEARLWNHDDGAGEALWAKMLKGAPRVPLPVPFGRHSSRLQITFNTS